MKIRHCGLILLHILKSNGYSRYSASLQISYAWSNFHCKPGCPGKTISIPFLVIVLKQAQLSIPAFLGATTIPLKNFKKSGKLSEFQISEWSCSCRWLSVTNKPFSLGAMTICRSLFFGGRFCLVWSKAFDCNKFNLKHFAVLFLLLLLYVIWAFLDCLCMGRLRAHCLSLFMSASVSRTSDAVSAATWIPQPTQLELITCQDNRQPPNRVLLVLGNLIDWVSWVPSKHLVERSTHSPHFSVCIFPVENVIANMNVTFAHRLTACRHFKSLPNVFSKIFHL